MSARRLLLASLVLPVAALANTSSASAAHPCDSASLQDGTVIRVAALRVSCARARAVAVGFFGGLSAGSGWDGKTGDGAVYYSVGGFRCFPGLGGSETWCKSRGRWVFASTRPEDHPGGWAPLAPRSSGVKTVVLCPDQYGNTTEYVKPARCEFLNADYFQRPAGATVSSAGSIHLIAMRWRRWGGDVARAVGIYAGNMGVRTHAVIRLSRPDRCSYLPEQVYTRFWIRIGGNEPFSYRLEGCA